MTGYLDTLIDLAATSQAERPALLAEAFAAAQIPRGGETARAITNMAARLDVADPAVRAAAREFQEATRARDRIRQTLAVETFKEQESRNLAQEEATKAELRAAEEKIASLEGRLQAELPRYAQITAARPVPVSELAPRLRPGEAVVQLLPTSDGTYVLLVRDRQAYAHRAAITAGELTRLVAGSGEPRSPTASSSRSTPRPPRASTRSCWPPSPSRCAAPRISSRCRAARC